MSLGARSGRLRPLMVRERPDGVAVANYMRFAERVDGLEACRCEHGHGVAFVADHLVGYPELFEQHSTR